MIAAHLISCERYRRERGCKTGPGLITLVQSPPKLEFYPARIPPRVELQCIHNFWFGIVLANARCEPR